MIISVCDQAETMWEEEKIPAFSPFPTIFKSFQFQGHYNSGLCGKELNDRLCL